MKRREKPLRRVNPSGRTVWVARWTDKTGKRRSAGTFQRKGEAQDAIDAAYDGDYRAPGSLTVDGYFAGWLERHPRAERTNKSYAARVRSVIDVKADGKRLGSWPMNDVTRRHVVDLIDDLLSRQGRAAQGAQGVMRALSAMWQDALDDLEATTNPFMRAKVRAADPRVRKAPMAVRVFSIEEMRRFAEACGEPSDPPNLARFAPQMHEYVMGQWEEKWAWRRSYGVAMVRMLSDCGLRLGELLALERDDRQDDMLLVRRTVHLGKVQQGTKTDHGESGAGRTVPLTPALASMLDALGERSDTSLLFPTQKGRVWMEPNFYRDVWYPARKITGMADARPHLFRHSWVTLLRAAGIDPADLADMAGHTVQTATAKYTHAARRSFEDARRVLSEPSSG